jgi:hypothetical protein
MLLTLLKALNTEKLDEVIGAMQMAALDIDVMLYDAQKRGQIEIDREKNKIKALTEPENFYYNEKLLEQLKKLIGFYDEQGANITRNRLGLVAVDPMGGHGYTTHDFECTMLYLDESGEVNKYEIDVPKKGKRPANKFEFYTFLDHQKFGEEAVEKFIDQFKKK